MLFGNQILDTNGDVFEVIKAREVKKIKPFWVFEFFNPLITVDLKLEKKKETYNLGSLKHKVRELMSISPGDWDSGGFYEDLIEIVEESRSIPELILGFSKFI